MKKFILFVFISLFFFPFMVHAVSGTESYNGEYRWNYEDGVLTITSDGGKMISDRSHHAWDEYKPEIKKIVFEGIDVIHDHNFENYPNLEEVVLDDNMGGEIADYAFYNCPKLDHIDLPDGGLSRIGKNAFYGTSIKEVEIPIFLSWLDENAFPEDTIIEKKADELGVLDAGTAGKLTFHADSSFPGEGYSFNNTCYNKFYYGRYYNNSAKWILFEDGTLLVYGTDLIHGYSGSRIPWGCYKKKIKKMIFNIDNTGTINISDGCCKTGNNYKIAIYASKPVEEIMDNRLKNINGNMFWDCREECRQSSFNVDTIIINRGIENINDGFQANEALVDKDIYINKYVKTINNDTLFLSDTSRHTETRLHIDASLDDFKSNNYSYKVFPDNSLYGNDILYDDQFVLNPIFNDPLYYKGRVINDIDDTYISINDDSAPTTISVDGKTYYKYDTYITNENREVNVSLPVDESVDYYVKEIESPKGCSIKEDAIHVDMNNPEIDLCVDHECSKHNIINPSTFHNFVIMLFLIILLTYILILSFRNKKEYL